MTICVTKVTVGNRVSPTGEAVTSLFNVFHNA